MDTRGSRSEAEVPTRISRRDLALVVLFAIYTSTVVLWLLGGLAPVLSATSPTVLATFAGWAEGGDALASFSRRVVQTSADAPRGATVLIDYFISVLGLSFALLIISLRPRDLAARLLAVGMVGIAAVFNQPSHSLFEILPEWIKQPGPHFIVHATAGPAFAHALLVFPDGRLRPRWAVWPLVCIYVLAWYFSTWDHLVFFLLFFGLVLPVLGITSQASRYRHAATEREKQQSKLMLSALVVASGVGLLFLTLNFTLELDPEQTNLAFRVFQPVLGVIPIALIIGLLHYRLWDIDGVVNRALVYGLLTAIVAVAYLAMVFLFGRLLGTIAGPASLAVDLASTLAVGAMFSPARHRIQKFIDKRFYRQRYNAVMTLEAFSARLRHEVDLDDLISALIAVVKDTMSPTHLSLWVCTPSWCSEEPQEPRIFPDRILRGEGEGPEDVTGSLLSWRERFEVELDIPGPALFSCSTQASPENE